MSLARSYARALYDAAVEAKTGAAVLDQIESELNALAQAIEGSREAKIILFGPATAAKEKLAAIQAVVTKTGVNKLVGQFMLLLARKGRLSALASIRDSFGAIRLEAEGGIQGRVVSADPLDGADVEALAGAFTQKLGKKVAFRMETDSSLLAGMKVIVNGVTYDGTLRSQLQRLRERLIHGAPAAH